MAPLQTYYANRLTRIKSPYPVSEAAVMAGGQIDLVRRCGFDGIDICVDPLSIVEACGSKVRCPMYGPPYMVAPAITNAGDVSRLEVPNPEYDARFCSSMRVGDIILKTAGGSLFTQASLIAPLTLAGELRGLDALLFDVNGQDSMVREIIERSSASIRAYLDELLKTDVDGIMLLDPVSSSSFISESAFLELSLPALEGLIHRIKRAGKVAMVHVCGESAHVLKHLVRTDLDVMWIDADLSVASRNMEEKTVMGNLSSHLLSKGTPERVLNESLDRLSGMATKRFVLSAGRGIPLTARLENLKMMRRACNLHLMSST